MAKKLLTVLFSLLLLSSPSLAEDVHFNIGDYNDTVISLHNKLNELGYFPLRAESPFSSQTVSALKTLQEDLGWEATGEIKSEDEFNEILNLALVVRENLLSGYAQKLNDSKFRSNSEDLDGETVLHLAYSEGDADYIDLIYWSKVIVPEGDQDYTLSFMAKGMGAIHSFFNPGTVVSGYSNKGSQTKSNDGNIETALSEDWTYYIITWHTKEDVEGEKNILAARVPKGTEIWISKIKFEKGSTATEWILPEE